jgi:hypothetical protein
MRHIVLFLKSLYGCGRALPTAVVRFVESAYKRPIWILASIVLFSGLGYIFAFESTKPEQVAAIEKTFEEARVYEEDFATLVEHSQGMVKANEDHLAIINLKIEILNDLLAGRPVSDKAREAHQRTAELIPKLSSFYNQSKAIALHFPESESFAKQVQRDQGAITQILEDLTMTENEFRALMTGDKKTFFENLNKATTEIPRGFPEQETRLAASQAHLKEQDALKRARDIAHEELLAKLSVLRLKVSLEDLAAGFALFYLVGCLWGVITEVRLQRSRQLR